MIFLVGCFLEEDKEICQFLKGSCESLMDSIIRIGRERKNKNKRIENNFQELINIYWREGESYFLNVYIGFSVEQNIDIGI